MAGPVRLSCVDMLFSYFLKQAANNQHKQSTHLVAPPAAQGWHMTSPLSASVALERPY